MKDSYAREIYIDINRTPGADCIDHSTVTKYLREKSFSKSMLDMDFEPKIEEENFIDEAILGALEGCPFGSLRQIAKRIFILISPVRYHLVSSLGYRIRTIRWVPHSFSSSQKQARVEMSQDFLQVLRSAEHHAWKYIVTLDEVWFQFSSHFDQIWLPHNEPPPFFPKQTMASQKSMITVVWNIQGFHVIQSVAKGIKQTGKYDSGNILFQIIVLRDVGSHRKMIVYADNAGPYVAKCATEYMDHDSLKRHEFTEGAELVSASSETLNQIPTETLVDVFDDWMRRLQQYIDISGEYLE